MRCIKMMKVNLRRCILLCMHTYIYVYMCVCVNVLIVIDLIYPRVEGEHCGAGFREHDTLSGGILGPKSEDFPKKKRRK